MMQFNICLPVIAEMIAMIADAVELSKKKKSPHFLQIIYLDNLFEKSFLIANIVNSISIFCPCVIFLVFPSAQFSLRTELETYTTPSKQENNKVRTCWAWCMLNFPPHPKW